MQVEKLRKQLSLNLKSKSDRVRDGVIPDLVAQETENAISGLKGGRLSASASQNLNSTAAQPFLDLEEIRRVRQGLDEGSLSLSNGLVRYIKLCVWCVTSL